MAMASMLVQTTRTGTPQVWRDVAGSLVEQIGGNLPIQTGEENYDSVSTREFNRVIAVVGIESGTASLEIFTNGGGAGGGIMRLNQTGGAFPSGVADGQWSNWEYDGGLSWSSINVDHGTVTGGPFEAGETVTSTSGGSGTISLVANGSSLGLQIIGTTGNFNDGDTLTQTTGTNAGANATQSGALRYYGHRQDANQGLTVHSGLHVIAIAGVPHLCCFWAVRPVTGNDHYRGATLDLTQIENGWTVAAQVDAGVILNEVPGNSYPGVAREWVFDGAIHLYGAGGGFTPRHLSWNPATNAYVSAGHTFSNFDFSVPFGVHNDTLFFMQRSSGSIYNLLSWNGTTFQFLSALGAIAIYGGDGTVNAVPSNADLQTSHAAMFSDGSDLWIIGMDRRSGSAASGQGSMWSRRVRGADIDTIALGGTQHEYQITCVADVAGSLQNKWFWIGGDRGARRRYFWFNVSGGGADPTPNPYNSMNGGALGNATAIPVAISTNDTADAVATALEGAITGLGGYNVSRVGNVVTFSSSSTLILPVPLPAQGDFNTGFTVAQTVQGSFEIADFQNDTIPVALRSPTSDINQFLYPLLDVETNPGQVDIYIVRHTDNSLTGVTATYHKWNVTPGVDPSANDMTTEGTGGDNRHAYPSVFPQGGERFWVSGKNMVMPTLTEPVPGGERVTYYPVGGGTGLNVDVRFNSEQNPATAQANLVGAVSGGGTRNGNVVENVDANGAARTLIVQVPQSGIVAGEVSTYHINLYV
jgi:hypothetical protein